MLAVGGVHFTLQVHIMSREPQARSTRRAYSAEFKQDLVERSLRPGASVSALALENGINANVLFNWRRLHLRSRGAQCTTQHQAVLLPVNVSASQELPVPAMPKSVTHVPSAGVIEIDMSGVRIRVRGSVDPANLQCVLQALRGLA